MTARFNFPTQVDECLSDKMTVFSGNLHGSIGTYIIEEV